MIVTAIALGSILCTACLAQESSETNSKTTTGRNNQAGQAGRVWIAPSTKQARLPRWYSPAIEQIDGTVIQFDHRGIQIRRSGETTPTSFAAARVLWIELDSPKDSAVKLMDHYTSGQFQESLLALPPALEDRPDVWQQQLLTMVAANAGCRSRREKISLELIAQLDRRPLPAFVLGWAPIAWTGYPLDAGGRTSAKGAAWIEPAKEKMEGDSPLASLVAASWLLSSQERSVAIRQIKTLMKNEERPSVAALAYCVLWTTATPPQVKSNQSKWIGQLEQLPMPLQMGPMFALQRKLAAASETQSANFLSESIDLTPIAPHPLLIDRRLGKE